MTNGQTFPFLRRRLRRRKSPPPLDLVVSVDTAVAHLAGALGVPVWMALPSAPDMRWGLAQEDSPWYPTARLFRQQRRGEWGPVFSRMVEELGVLVRGGLRPAEGTGTGFCSDGSGVGPTGAAGGPRQEHPARLILVHRQTSYYPGQDRFSTQSSEQRSRSEGWRIRPETGGKNRGDNSDV